MKSGKLEDLRSYEALVEIRRLRTEVSDLKDANSSLEHEVETVRRELADIRSGIGWRLLALYRHVRLRACPSGTRRDRTLRRVLSGANACAQLGFYRTART